MTVQDIARKFGVSTRHVQASFARQGVTLSAYIATERLDRAARLLNESRPLSITEIAFRCGFEDVGNFGRAFRKRMNLSPSQFRLSDRAEGQ